MTHPEAPVSRPRGADRCLGMPTAAGVRRHGGHQNRRVGACGGHARGAGRAARVKPGEIGASAGPSARLSGEKRQSGFLHERAGGGAALSARMAEPEMLAQTLAHAAERVDCPEGFARGGPACILRLTLTPLMRRCLTGSGRSH